MPKSYEQLAEELTELFDRGEYKRCISLANMYLNEYLEHSAHLNYLRMCSAARLGDKGLSIAILDEMLNREIWYSEELLTRSPSLAELQNDAVFQDLIRRSVEIKEQMTIGSDQTLLLLHDTDKCIYSTSDDIEPCPLLVALHSNGELPQDTINGWKSAAQIGCLVAIPKSSKTLWAGGGHYWINHHEASGEIFNQIASLHGNYNYDEDRLVLGGFSMGAEIALWMALQGMLNAAGFVLLAPSGPYFDDPIRWKHLIEDAQGSNLRGVIMLGEDDQHIAQEVIRSTIALLSEHGIETKLIMFNGGRIYPPNFSKHLETAINFIL